MCGVETGGKSSSNVPRLTPEELSLDLSHSKYDATHQVPITQLTIATHRPTTRSPIKCELRRGDAWRIHEIMQPICTERETNGLSDVA